ncbi:MAG TPA: acetyl-CoA carboxylase biotin carboxyl carrier protein subunit [Thermoanaerobacterales bacterium]|nr:acetyl-CoA carboxylase biotin carboxyl carrier protein subunit [Thermoanaerobacterales bacterium]
MSKKFKITVDGEIYEVQVEELYDEDDNKVQEPDESSSNIKLSNTNLSNEDKKRDMPDEKVSKSEKEFQIENGTQVKAPMPGTIISLQIELGYKVEKGATLMVLEAMKMENEIIAPASGTVLGIMVKEGSTVESGEVLAVLG